MVLKHDAESEITRKPKETIKYGLFDIYCTGQVGIVIDYGLDIVVTMEFFFQDCTSEYIKLSKKLKK